MNKVKKTNKLPLGRICARSLCNWLAATIICLTFASCDIAEKQRSQTDSWTFVSVPDFLNKDTLYPHPGFEEGLTYFLQTLKSEDPDFLLVAGDMVDGRWPSKLEATPEAVIESAAIYYPAWIERMKAHDLKFYTAVGDHEIGDNPWPEEKTKVVPVFEEQYRKYFQMPENGPASKKGLTYYVLHNNTLILSLDVFEQAESEEGYIAAQFTGEQLAWLEEILEKYSEVDHVIAMGHTPILGPVNRRHSSGMMLEGGRDSDLWKTLSKYGVDVYLCGEVHAITCTERDGVQQIAHGSLFGWASTVNYLVGRVTSERIELEMKQIDIIPNVVDRKSLSIGFTEEAMDAGFRVIGSMVVDKSDEQAEKIKTGCFVESE